MNLAIVQTLLQTLLSLALSMTTSKQADAIIQALINVLPWAIKEAESLVPAIKNIVAVLKGNSAVTDAQMQALSALDAQADKAFEDSLSAYLSSHLAGTVGAAS